MNQVKISFPFPLAVVTATKSEFYAVYNRFIIKKDLKLNQNFSKEYLYSGKLNDDLIYIKPYPCFKINDDVSCVLSDYGKINAAAVTQWAIDTLKAKCIINYGTAAGITDKANIGDIFIAHTFYDHQQKSFTSNRNNGNCKNSVEASVSNKTKMMLNTESKQLYRQLTKLYPGIKKGIIASGDEDIDSKEKRQFLYCTYKADCADWESFAIAKIAHKNQIPCLVIRVISDMGDEDFYKDYMQNLPMVLEKGSDTIYKIVTQNR